MNTNKQHMCNVLDWKLTYLFEHKHVCQTISLQSLAMLLTFVNNMVNMISLIRASAAYAKMR